MRPLFLFMSFAAESSYMDDSRASDWLPVEGFQYEALFQRAARLLLCSAVRWCSIIFLESIMGSWGLLMGSSHYILRSLALWNLNLINLLFPIRLNEGFQFNRDVLGFSDDPLLTEKLNLILPQRFVVQSTAGFLHQVDDRPFRRRRLRGCCWSQLFVWSSARVHQGLFIS